MKKLLVQSHDLDNAFLEYKGKAAKIKRTWSSELALDQLDISTRTKRRRPTITKRVSTMFLADSDSMKEESAHSKCPDSPTNESGGMKRPSSVAKQLSNLLLRGDRVKESESHEDKSDTDKSLTDLVASDLMAFLGIEIEEAEEMIFLADEDDDEDAGTIDRAEFQHFMSKWA